MVTERFDEALAAFEELGGDVAEPVNLHPMFQEMAVRAASALGATYAGVNILPMETAGEAVIKVSGIPVWHGLQATTELGAASCLVSYLLQE